MVWLITMLTGLVFYTGSSFVYLLFSIVFLALLVDGLMRGESLGYKFFTLFLWLGFWLKFVVHLLLKYPFLEPVGYFDDNPASWDKVLLVSSMGAFAVLVSATLISSRKTSHVNKMLASSSYAPRWYLPLRHWLWGGVFVAIFLIPSLNIFYGLFQIGLIPKLVLPWPLNGLTAWLLGFGLLMVLYTLVFWDQSLKLSWKIGFLGVLAESLLSGLSVLSRSIYLFHSIPYLYELFKSRLAPKLTLSMKGSICVVWLLFFVASISAVTMMRYSDLSPIDASSDKSITLTNTDFFGVADKVSRRVASLIVDRWIGIEGVMATVAYPAKSVELFQYALQERRVKGELDIYTQKIANTKLSDADIQKYQYATIPGGIAFFYYTGSVLCVFIGMVLLTCLIFVTEKVVFILTKNPYFCAFWSMGIAQGMASFGLGIYQTAVYYVFCFSSMAVIFLLQTATPSANLSKNN